MHHIGANYMHRKKKLVGNYTRMLSTILNKSWKQYLTCTATYLPLKKNIQDEQHMRNSAGESRIELWVTFFYGHLHMDMPVLAEYPELTYYC